jgi:hypothetical protein
MSKPTANCPKCKREVDCFIERGSLFCERCWYRFESPEPGEKIENGNRKSGLVGEFLAIARGAFIFLLVLAGIFLVFLAFIYAACSQIGKI